MCNLNNFVKQTVLNVNFLFFVLAVTLIALSVFVLVSDWGTLDPSFFIGWGIIAILFGSIIILVAILGCLGVQYQRKRTGILFF